MGEAMDTPALRKRYNSPAVAVAAQTSAPEMIPPVLAEPFAQTYIGMVILPLFHSVERKTPQVEEPAVVAASSTANYASPATAREIHRKGPIELKDTLSGRVIVDATSSSPPSPGITVLMDVSTRAVIEVCSLHCGRMQEGRIAADPCFVASVCAGIVRCVVQVYGAVQECPQRACEEWRGANTGAQLCLRGRR